MRLSGESATTCPYISVVVPVHNGGAVFARCLSALRQSSFRNWELIVVDDCSTDNSADLAAEFGAKVLKTSARLGPAFARNLGAQAATGEYLCFVDADCEVERNTLVLVARHFAERPDVEAMFGSYDLSPAAPNFVSQYKNLMHRYVHQASSSEASTFWAGCGAVRRSTFLALGGFDASRYARPSIEDIEFGYRLNGAGGRIFVAKNVQVKHHKVWTFSGLVKTDVMDRGIPWTTLILERKQHLVNQLNIKVSDRASVAASYILMLSLLLSPWRAEAAGSAILAAVFLLVSNRHVYHYFVELRGLWFAARVVPMHWLYFLYCGMSFIGGLSLHLKNRLSGKTAPLPVPPLLSEHALLSGRSSEAISHPR